MAKVHGKNTVVKVDAVDLSGYVDSSELPRTADSHDTTTYGNDAHRYDGGLLDGTFTMSGTYDNTAATGPKAVLEPLLGTVVPIIRQPDGTGTGKAQNSFDGLMTKYTETNPVADMVKWSCEFQIDGDVDNTAQV
ncbi:MAG TPA: hypothetical protein VIQ30_18855 [Pseudonocardia sp.]